MAELAHSNLLRPLPLVHMLSPREELNSHLAELERANLLRPASTDVWEWTMVERDIVYGVLPHYQRRRLHAQLAQVMQGRVGFARWCDTFCV